MKKTINQQILSELKKINKNFEVFLKPEVTGKPIEYDTDQYIKLEMKDTMSAQSLFGEAKKLFPCYSYLNLSNITSERTGNYTVYFKSVQEADEENKNLSADDIKAKGMKTITLEERLLLEIVYFKYYGKHLDVDNWTLCSGSRCADGFVPGCRWNDGKFRVRWCGSGNHDDYIRARSVVSLPPKAKP